MIRRIYNRITDLASWKTNRKLLVIQSDDWGAIRMRSKSTYEHLLKKGFEVDQCIYNKYDTIERNTDLDYLFNVLINIRDSKGNHPVFTLNYIAVNPDFQKIVDSKYQNYFYEPFEKTLTRYEDTNKVKAKYYDALKLRLIDPQFHGREHLNVNKWLEDIVKDDSNLQFLVSLEMFTAHKSGVPSGRKGYLGAFGGDYQRERISQRAIVKTGLDEFCAFWGYSPKSFIAPCYIWPDIIEAYLADFGVEYIQTARNQLSPQKTVSKIDIKRHYTGQTNSTNQIYLVRNVYFEPVENKNKDYVNDALKDINRVFKQKMPAIISTHRVNYMGGIFEENRNKNIQLLNTLLKQVLKRWPDVEFISTEELGRLVRYS